MVEPESGLFLAYFAETERDQVVSSFTLILRDALETCAGALAFVFVDREGECIDYATRIPAFDAKIAGAQFKVLEPEILELAQRLGGGHGVRFEVAGTERTFLGAPLGEGYLVLAVMLSGASPALVDAALEEAAVRLRAEAGLETPAWDPRTVLEVETRLSLGWSYAPAAYRYAGVSYQVADVLGCWDDGGNLAGEVVCFRVRLDTGAEHTLAHDPRRDRWHYRD